MKDRRRRHLGRAVVACCLGGVIVCLITWQLLRLPALTSDAGWWLGRPASVFGYGGFDTERQVWRLHDNRLRFLATRAAMTLTATGILGLVLLHGAWVRRHLAEFFTTPRHHLNLAVFRVVLFGEIYRSTNVPLIELFASLPNSLQFSPATGIPQWGILAGLSHWPVHPLAEPDLACSVLKAACVTGMCGLFTRTSALLVALLTFGITAFLSGMARSTTSIILSGSP